jgi:hypothetical protein
MLLRNSFPKLMVHGQTDRVVKTFPILLPYLHELQFARAGAEPHQVFDSEETYFLGTGIHIFIFVVSSGHRIRT